MSLFYNQTVQRLRPTVRTNRSGEQELSYAGLESAEGVDWTGVHVRPTQQLEVLAEDRETAVSQWRIGSEPGRGDFDLLSTDWVRLPDGIVCSVVGEVARPSNPLNGSIDHLEVNVQRAIG
jgi:hypothetical protein